MKRNLAIDVLRGFSILMVLCTHGIVPKYPFDLVIPADTLQTIWRNGYYGVCMFFVISGFLITSNSLKRYGRLSEINFREFYTMRLARIAPCLLLFLGIAVLFHELGVPEFVTDDLSAQVGTRNLFYEGVYHALIFQYNHFYLFADIKGLWPLSPLWSLSIEEIFYLLFPILSLFFRRTWILALAMIAMIIHAPFYRTGLSQTYLWWGTADLIAFGCLAAMAAKHFTKIPLGITAAKIIRTFSALMLVVVFATVFINNNLDIGPLLIGIATALFLFSNAYIPIREGKNWIDYSLAPIAIFGILSYELYIFHTGIRALVLRNIPGFEMSYALVLALLLFAYLLYAYFTEPMNQKIRAFYASPKFELAEKSGKKGVVKK